MARRTRRSHNFFGAVLGLGLLSLLLLGSPGCGCGDDSLLPPGDEGPERCCCDFEWLPPRDAFGDDVVITFENADASLDAEATPTLLTDVNITVPEAFTVCVNEDHLLGDSVEIVFSDQATNEEYGRAALIYDQRCTPVIEPLSDDLQLTSTDCGGEPLQCCCEFEWRPGPNMSGDVNLVAADVTGGLDPTITPNAFTDVGPDTIELFDICVDPDHTLGATMSLEVRQQGSGALMGVVQLAYEERCLPEVVAADLVESLDITSTECGGEPLECCCLFEWWPGANMTGDVNLTAENVSAGLTVNITPSSLTGVGPEAFEQFNICINADHNLLDAFDLVVTSTSGPEYGRARIIYRERCLPEIAKVPGTPNLVLTSQECGGDPIVCCCEIRWLAPTSPAYPVINATLENVHASLAPASVTPPQVLDLPEGGEIIFTVCVDPTHDNFAGLELVLRDPTGFEISRVWLDYFQDEPCVPLEDDSTGEGFWDVLCGQIVTSD